ncbi:MAG: hypothetical protein Q9166_001426 [cf. Caloplaca sp. 2 TL-2023]
MPPAAASPDKPLNRRRRKQRNTDVSQRRSSGLAEELVSRQTKSDLDLPENQMETPSTPPTTDARPVLPDYSVPGQVSWSDRGTERRKDTPKKTQGGFQNGSSQPPKSNSTPRPNQRPISLTPGKKNATPSRAYAGPTFHASPAASSLPMPKFYSTSVPDVNRTSSMQIAMKEAAELSSDQSEGSPTPGFTHGVGQELGREESPLDIFFKADREQKERQRLEQQVSPAGQDPPNATPALNRPQNHSRQSPNGSQGGLFPMELDNKEPAKTSHEKAFSDPTTGGIAADKSEALHSDKVLETPEQAKRRRAKTIALKKLLMTSVPLTANPASTAGSGPEGTNTEHSSPSPQSKRASNTHIHKQIAAQTARQVSPCPRPSSNLRKELSASNLPENEQMSELPATPTPSPTRNAHMSARPQNPPFVAQGSSSRPSPAPEPAVNPFKNMEDDLRRILKMNDLPSSSATGVRS